MTPHRHLPSMPVTRSHTHAPRPMSRRVRSTVMIVSAALWLSGMIWMLLHYFFQVTTEFGNTPSTWEPFTIRIHGILALLAVFMLGWIGGTHVTIRWRQVRTHVHGLILLITCIVLTLSGYALYYVVDDAPRHVVGVTHEIIGALVIVIALIHWRKRAVADRS
jgi:hypothetical protein